MRELDIDVIVEDPTEDVLEIYSWVSIKFQVASKLAFNLQDNGLGGMTFSEEEIEPYVKDYDTKDYNPRLLPNRFDLSHWKVFSAFDGDYIVGGAIVAMDTEGIHMLEGRNDLAVLWDIRVSEDYRGKCIGGLIMNEVKAYVRDAGCNRLKIETQNNNVGACKFYVNQGAKLSNINKHVYKEYPEDVQLIWSIDL